MRHLLGGLAIAGALAVAPSAASAQVSIDVTVRSETGVGFSAPIFTFRNLSNPAYLVTNVSVVGGYPWDWVYQGPSGSPYEILNPAGGTRTLLEGEEATVDQNNGCTGNISYGLTSFNAGDTFRFSADPEGGGCGSAVIDVRPGLTSGTLGISATFSNGMILSGSTWVQELIDPLGNPNADSNQLYRLTLSAAVGAVPEPATWAMMILGFGAAGTALRRRRRVSVRFA